MKKQKYKNTRFYMVSNIYKQDSSGKFAHFMLIICLFAEIEVNLQELLCLLR